MKIVFS